jgi:hypothetical protein
LSVVYVSLLPERPLKTQENSIVLANVVVDEMSIKDKIEFDGTKFHGLVDMGSAGINNCENDNMDHATNALVFMAVGINSH